MANIGAGCWVPHAGCGALSPPPHPRSADASQGRGLAGCPGLCIFLGPAYGVLFRRLLGHPVLSERKTSKQEKNKLASAHASHLLFTGCYSLASGFQGILAETEGDLKEGMWPALDLDLSRFDPGSVISGKQLRLPRPPSM